jgi:hypothetical protein
MSLPTNVVINEETYNAVLEYLRTRAEYSLTGREKDLVAKLEETSDLVVVGWQGRQLDQSDDKEGWSEWHEVHPSDLPVWGKRCAQKTNSYELRAVYGAELKG